MPALKSLRLLWLSLSLATGAGCLSAVDGFGKSQAAARDLALGERLEIWRSPTDARGADLLLFLDPFRILVGEIEGGGVYSSPRHGPLKLIDARNGGLFWTTRRDGLPKGSYALLATSPLLVFLGAAPGEATLFALDPATGSRRWKLTLDGHLTHQQLPAGGRTDLVVVTERGKRATLQRINLTSGRAQWSTPLDGGGGPILALGDRICLGGSAVRCHDAASGRRLFTASLPALGAPIVLTSLLDGPDSVSPALIAYSAKGLALVGRRDGAVHWTQPSPSGQGIKLVTGRGDLVLTLSGDGKLLGTDMVRALSALDGAPRWATDADGTVVSALHTTDSLVIFTIEDQLVALRKGSGEPAFRAPLDRAFSTASPSTTGGTPDLLLVTADRVLVDRDEAGLQAVSLPQGAPTFRVDAKGRLSVGRTYQALMGAMKIVPQHRPPMVRYVAAAPSPMRRLTQEQVDRMSYHQLKAHVATERAQAKAELGVAVAGAVSSLAQIANMAFEQAFLSGLVGRVRMGLADAHRARALAFQGSMHVHWFEDELGAGVRLLRLADGKLDTLRVGPRDPLHRILAAGSAHVALSPDSRHLVTVNLGLRADRYHKASSAGAKGVEAAILCFDVTSPRPRRPAYAPQPTGGVAAPVAKTFADAVVLGNVEAARVFLDRGADPNGIILPSSQFTALRYAAASGRATMVSLLLERGAKPTRLDVQGPTALDLAHGGNHAEIITLLEKAGAMRRPQAAAPTPTPGAPMDGRSSPVSPEQDALARVFRAGLMTEIRRALRKAGPRWREAPVVVAALEGERNELALELLEAGADPNGRNDVGNTALHLAAARDLQPLMRFLLSRKADPNARNHYGRTPLMNALGDPAAGAFYTPSMTTRAELLLAAGADPNQRYGALSGGAPSVTLLDLARKKGHGLPALLRRYGAR